MAWGALKDGLARLPRGEFDLVHIHTPFIAHYAGVRFARANNIPCVATYHTFFEEYLHHYLPVVPIFRILVATTGILPRFQGKGFGHLLKCWQIVYAHHHGFTRIVTNHRKSNRPIIELNQKFGFKIIRQPKAQYFEDPPEPTVVMELRLRLKATRR